MKGNAVKYCSSNSILVINPKGKIKQVFTPFIVTAINTSTNKRRVYVVDEVLSTPRDELIYIINGVQFHYSQFTIQIQF